MSRRSLALGLLLGGSLLSLTASSVDSRAGQDLVRALAVVVLIGTVLIVVLRGGGRRWVGLLLAAGGLAMAGMSAMQPGPAFSWRVASLLGGVLVTSGGLLTMITGGRWPAPGHRFERKEAATWAGTENPADFWRAMDAGLDPTVDPDVRKGDSGDTMRSADKSQQ